MPKIIKKNNFSHEILESLKDKIFIYPTDTIYGIGCDATNVDLVEKIREIKGRDKKPFSVIVPSIEFIKENFELDALDLEKYLPGPYTLILKKKNLGFLKGVSDNEFVGVRIPNSDFCDNFRELGVPIVTTSVNFSGEKPANSIGEIDQDILEKVDLVVDGGTLSGKSSTIVKDGKEIER